MNKSSLDKEAKKLLSSIPRWDSDRLDQVLPVKVGRNLKRAIQILAHNLNEQVGEFARIAIEQRVHTILNDMDEAELVKEWKKAKVPFEIVPSDYEEKES